MRYILTYRKIDGVIIAVDSEIQSLENIFPGYPMQEILENVGIIELEDFIENFRDFKVVDGNLVLLTGTERAEIIRTGRILDEGERLIESLKPSLIEIEKAKNTIEILELLSEVL